jgi:hypothetical protein
MEVALPTDQSRVVAHGPRAALRRRKRRMSGRPDPACHAVEFLRKELANGPVLVSELEAAARAAGLLGSDQSISDAKLFKRAKKSLNIRSVRNGFGSAGEWFWLLETPAPLVADRPSKVAPRIPSSWIEGVGRLTPHRPPPDVPMHRWRQFLTDCNQFLGPSGWAERAAAKGWDALALFGCCRLRPLDRAGGAGLLWAINGGRLVEFHRDWAVFELAENGSARIFDRRRLNAANFRPPWIGA